MNTEEAKVPNDKSDWQSLEIFLFSNGQKYSPPRKYHLRADDRLNGWDAILNHLAKSHYGLRSPRIHLYTTNGQLVENPLELKNGQAYVAVAPPDTFIDTGYQKYLLRASRSWEKRQARKKIPEADYLEPLLSAAGHPELRPAGGHFMSSAPTKPVAADDGGPRSGKIGAMMNENKIRPDDTKLLENETKPASAERVRPGESAARSEEQRAGSDEHGPSPGKCRPCSDERGAKLTGYEARSDSEPLSSEVGRENEDRTDKNIVEKDADEEYDVTSKFRKQSSRLSDLSENNLENRETGRREETEYMVKQSDQKASDIEHTRRLSEQRGADIVHGNRTSEPTRESEHGERESEQKSREINSARRASGQRARESGGRLSEQRTKQTNHIARLDIHETKVGDHEARADDFGLRTSDHEARVGNSGSREAKYSARAIEPRSRANPRDGMSSRARTNQPKLGTPGTRVDETAARLDNSEMKDKVGEPETKVGSFGGTGVARRPSTENKRFSIGKNSSLLRKPTPIFSDKKPIKTNKYVLPKRIIGKASTNPVPAYNEDVKSKTESKYSNKRITPLALPPPTADIDNFVIKRKSTSITKIITNQKSPTKDKAPFENVINGKEIIDVASSLFRNPESETVRSDLVKQVVDAIRNSPEETQTELICFQQSMTSVSVDYGAQTYMEIFTEEKEQHGQRVSPSSKEKVYSNTLCYQRKNNATKNPDENFIAIPNTGDVVNLKLKIEIRNVVRSVYPCQNNSQRSQSLTNTSITRREKESQMSVDDKFVQSKSMQSILNNEYFRGCCFEGCPKVMVVQYAGSEKLKNPPRCDPPQCCDNNKYFVVLQNSLSEDDRCNYDPLCQASDQRHSESKRPSVGALIKRTFSDVNLDTVTTITISGVPLQMREKRRDVTTTNSACQTEDPQCECQMIKRKVTITEDSGMGCNCHNESISQISVSTQAEYLVKKYSCPKICSQKGEQEDSQLCSEFCPPVSPKTCEKVQSQVGLEVSSQTCSRVQSKECQHTYQEIESQVCHLPLPCIQVQTQGCLEVCRSNAHTQTQWRTVVLEARLHEDGRYSLHLPPLHMLNQYLF